MRKSYDYILSNLVFITRIPVHLKFDYKSDSGNVKFFPLIGIILGFIMLVVTLFAQILFGNMVAAIVSVFTMVLLTGGIHLDGLSDTADGLFSYKSKDEIIEIMKDSHVGAMGVIALVALLMLKVAFVNLLLNEHLVLLIFLYPLLGRLAIVNACYLGKPIKKSKLGAGYIGNIGNFEFLLIQLIYTFSAFVYVYVIFEQSYAMAIAVVISAVVMLIAAKFIVSKVQSQIGGISGDILGAVCEIGEVLSLPALFLGVKICEKLI